ncbi:MAG: hypothetical protein WB947_07300 [Thermoplasmata archaeon]
MTRGGPHSPRIVLYAVLVAIAITVTGFGVAAGLSTQVSLGSTESGQGSSVTEHPLAYWTWGSTQLGTIPARVPAAVSLVATAPTLLPRAAGRSYAINAAVARQTSVVWTFDELTTAPRSTELMITFVDGLSGAATTIVAYVETRAAAPAGTLAFIFYWDAGAFAPTGLAIESMTATVQACTAIGTCP